MNIFRGLKYCVLLKKHEIFRLCKGKLDKRLLLDFFYLEEIAFL